MRFPVLAQNLVSMPRIGLLWIESGGDANLVDAIGKERELAFVRRAGGEVGALLVGVIVLLLLVPQSSWRAGLATTTLP